MLMIDIAGTQLSDEDKSLICHPWVIGVVLFTRNFTSVSQLQQLVQDIRALQSREIIIAVDHEGGRVQRFRDGFYPLPALSEIGALYVQDLTLACQLAEAVGYVSALELQSVGLDMTFAPVLDLNHGSSRVIGDRSFHQDPYIVTRLAAALCDGLHQGGFPAVGKHFPGHGYVTADSHESLPTDQRDFDLIEVTDLQPYQGLIKLDYLEGVMTAHVLYPHYDDVIASLSKKWIGEVLRKNLNFSGVIFSDCLSMAAVSQTYPDPLQRVELAYQAGSDVVLMCNIRPEVVRVIEDIKLMKKHLRAQNGATIMSKLRRHRQPHFPTFEHLNDIPAYQKACELLDKLTQKGAAVEQKRVEV